MNITYEQYKDRIWAWLLGLGIISIAITNPFMQLGIFLTNSVLIVVLLADPSYRKRITLGSKYIYIPLLVIVFSMLLSNYIRFTNDNNITWFIGSSYLPFYFLFVYMACRVLGKEVFKPFGVAVIILALVVIYHALFIHYGERSGVLLDNYNLATALLIIGSAFFAFKGQYYVALIGVIGSLFTGAPEGLVALACLIVVFIIKKAITKKVIIGACITVVILLIGIFPCKYTLLLNAQAVSLVSNSVFHKIPEFAIPSLEYQNPDMLRENEYKSDADYLLHGRVTTVTDKINELKPFYGSGYVLMPINWIDYPIYNIPLVVAQQTGILSALAWLFVTIYCLVKTKWVYAFVAIIGYALLDHQIYCQLGLWWWALIGVATSNEQSIKQTT